MGPRAAAAAVGGPRVTRASHAARGAWWFGQGGAGREGSGEAGGRERSADATVVVAPAGAHAEAGLRSGQ